jgi:hypothetical protein
VAGSNVVVAASFSSSITYDTGMTLNSQTGSDEDVFITALDQAGGTTQWAGEFGSTNNDNVGAITATPTGAVLLAGLMTGTMQGLQGAGMPVTLLGDAGTGGDLYILKVDPSGKAIYNLVYGDPNSGTTAGGIAYGNGAIAVAGTFSGSIDFGKGTFTSMGNDGMLFVVDETSKKTTFATQLGGAASDGFTTVAIDPWGEIIGAGYYGNQNASAQLGSQVLQQTTLNTAGMVLAKWNPTGSLLWYHAYVPTLDGGAPPYVTPDSGNAPEAITPARVQVTSKGVVVVAGTMGGGADFGKGYEGQVSTFPWGRCTCFKCYPGCFIINPPTCCNTPSAGWSADGILGVWQP